MNNAQTAEGRGTDGPNDAEPFFPSEGTFHPVVPLSEIGRETPPAPLLPVKAAAAGKPAEAAWAREAHRAALKDEEETTLVPKRRGRARAARRSWLAPAAVIALSVLAGLASGTYLIRSTQRTAETQPPAQVATEQVAAEAPTLPPANAATPAPVAEAAVAEAEVEKVKEAAAEDKSGEVAKAEQPREAARPAASGESASRPAPPTRAERPARAAAEAREVAPAPKPSRGESTPRARTRATAAAKRPPAPAPPPRALPVSDPPPSAKSRKVIQWP